MNDFEILQVWELRGELVESVLEDFVHLWGATDPQLFASFWQAFVQEGLVPSARLLVRESQNELEVLGLHLLQKLE